MVESMCRLGATTLATGWWIRIVVVKASAVAEKVTKREGKPKIRKCSGALQSLMASRLLEIPLKYFNIPIFRGGNANIVLSTGLNKMLLMH